MGVNSYDVGSWRRFNPICKRMREFDMNKKFYVALNTLTIVASFASLCFPEKDVPHWFFGLFIFIGAYLLGAGADTHL